MGCNCHTEKGKNANPHANRLRLCCQRGLKRAHCLLPVRDAKSGNINSSMFLSWKNYKRQDKELNADSAFIFLITHLNSQNGQNKQVVLSGEVGQNGEDCHLVIWSGVVWYGLSSGLTPEA